MIEFISENEFQLQREVAITEWLSQIISSEEYVLGELSIVFCNDEFLHRINLEFLNHDTLTDIISFDYSLGKEVHGEIYVSTERVADNAQDLNLEFEEELHRVLAHGVLHLCGYGDKTDDEVTIMRSKENEALKLLIDVK